MKKTAEILHIVFRVMAIAIAWLLLLVAMVGSALEILDVGPMLFIVFPYLILVETLKKYALLLVLPFVGMFGSQFLVDHLANRKPVYLGLVQLTAEATAWLLKYLPIYIGVRVEFRVISWMLNPAVLDGASNFFLDALRYLLFPDWMLLVLTAVVAVVHLVCVRYAPKD